MLDYKHFTELNDLFATGNFTGARQLLMRMHARCVALYDEVASMKKRLRQAQDILFLARNLHFESHKYWLQSEGIRLGPFCPECYNNYGVLNKLDANVYGEHCEYCGYSRDDPLPLAVGSSLKSAGPCRRIPFAPQKA